MPWFKLGARFWDGSALHNRGDVIHLLEGVTPPPRATPTENPNAKNVPKTSQGDKTEVTAAAKPAAKKKE
jgi:hypothetical protein